MTYSTALACAKSPTPPMAPTHLLVSDYARWLGQAGGTIGRISALRS